MPATGGPAASAAGDVVADGPLPTTAHSRCGGFRSLRAINTSDSSTNDVQPAPMCHRVYVGMIFSSNEVAIAWPTRPLLILSIELSINSSLRVPLEFSAW